VVSSSINSERFALKGETGVRGALSEKFSNERVEKCEEILVEPVFVMTVTIECTEIVRRSHVNCTSGEEFMSHKLVDNIVGSSVCSCSSEKMMGVEEHLGRDSSAKIVFKTVSSESWNEEQVVASRIIYRSEFEK